MGWRQWTPRRFSFDWRATRPEIGKVSRASRVASSWPPTNTPSRYWPSSTPTERAPPSTPRTTTWRRPGPASARQDRTRTPQWPDQCQACEEPPEVREDGHTNRGATERLVGHQQVLKEENEGDHPSRHLNEDPHEQPQQRHGVQREDTSSWKQHDVSRYDPSDGARRTNHGY